MMYGRFWSYAPTRCADGSMGASANGHLPGIRLADDQFGNIWLYGRPRRGESVPEWIRRKVSDELDNHGPVWREARTDGQGFILEYGQYVKPWFVDPNARVVTVREEFGERGCYVVEVYPYKVELVKR